MPPRFPLRKVSEAMSRYKRDNLSRLADVAGLSRGTGDAIQQYAMGATDPLDEVLAAKRGIEAFARIPRGVKSLDDLIYGGHPGGTGLRFHTNKDDAEAFGDLGSIAYKAGGPENMQTARVMLNTDLNRLAMEEAPMHAQPEVVRRVASEYGVGDKEGLHELGQAVRRDVRSGDGWMMPRQDVDMITKRRLSAQGVDGTVVAHGRGAKIGMFDPARVKILERLAAMGLTGEALVQAVQQMSAPQQKKQPTGGW